MANQITIIFQPCSPTPLGGYKVQYRPVGSSDPYITHPDSFSASPIVFDDGGASPDGTEYEGYIYSDCGNGVYGNFIPWSSDDCEAVVLPEGISFPNAIVGIPYSYSFVVEGSAPFVISGVTKPAWMTITATGNTISFTGTPTGGTVEDTPIAFTIENCSGANTVAVDETMNVYEANLFIENLLTSPAIYTVNNLDGTGGFAYSLTSGSLPLPPGNSASGVHSGYPGPNLFITHNLIVGGPAFPTSNKKVQVRKNGVIVASAVMAFGTTTTNLPGVTFTAADEIKVQIVFV